MWTNNLKIDPLILLLSTDETALKYFIQRDLLQKKVGSIEKLWDLPEPAKTLNFQQADGSWIYKGSRPGDELGENYELLETWKKLRGLVEMFGFTREHPAIEKAAEFIFSCQTEEGDIRGILSNQYTPYYMGAFMEILIKAGYEDDKRVSKAFKWLENMQQERGGWIIPMNMYKMREYNTLCNLDPIPPMKEMPFSHMATGMVIRAYAAHSSQRAIPTAIRAGKLLKSRFFEKDTFTSRQAVEYWFKFRFPFWWTDLLTAMDSLMRLGFSPDDREIQKGLDWFINHQNDEGGWVSSYGKKQLQPKHLWVTYAICRVLKHFLD